MRSFPCFPHHRRLAYLLSCLLVAICCSTPKSSAVASLVPSATSFPPTTQISEPLLIWKARHCEIIDDGKLQEAFLFYLQQQPLSSSAVSLRKKRLQEISHILGRGVCSAENLAKGFQLLQQLAIDPLDDGSARQLLKIVVQATTVLSRKQNPSASEIALRNQQEILSWNMQVDEKKPQLDPSLTPSTKSRKKTLPPKIATPSEQKLNQIKQEISLIELGTEVSELQTRLEFQDYALRLLQRGDYPEAVLSVRFYRGIFGDQLAPLRLGPEAKEQLAPLGITPDLGDIEDLAVQSEAIVSSRLSDCASLLETHAVGAATKCLKEAFAQGSRSLNVLSFSWEAKQIIHLREKEREQARSLIASKDYEEALSALDKLQEDPSSSENSELKASIVAAQALSALHLATAQQAAHRGHNEEAEKEWQQADDLWPHNPGLASARAEMKQQEEMREQTVKEFDKLMAVHQVNDIEKQQARFETAFLSLPDRQAMLKKLLATAQQIREGINKVKQLQESDNLVASWESARTLQREFPWDEQLKQLTAAQAGRVENLARGITAVEREESSQPVLSLAQYLKLQRSYPQSHLAADGVKRLSSELLNMHHQANPSSLLHGEP